MHYEIIRKLQELERIHDIKILYAVESGSRGWGFESKDSDYDARFIYIHKSEWYLAIDDKKDFINEPVDEVLDVSGWDIRKSLRLLRKSNPPLLEWLTSPIVYVEECTCVERLRKLSSEFFSPVSAIYHYLHIAKNKYEEIQDSSSIKIKKYFYILRPLIACQWIEQVNTMPPMEFHKMLEKIEIDHEIGKSIKKLLIKKANSVESDFEPMHPELKNFFSNQIEYYTEYIKTLKHEKMNKTHLLDQFFQETLKEVWKE